MVKANETQNVIEEKRCLLVEDRERAKSEYLELLEHLKYSVKVTKEGKEALKIIEEWSPHIMLVHFSQDISSSIDLIKTVSKKDSTVLTIYTTAYHDSDVFVKAMNAGAFWILRKPFIAIELEAILERAFKESAQKKNLKVRDRQEC